MARARSLSEFQTSFPDETNAAHTRTPRSAISTAAGRGRQTPVAKPVPAGIPLP